MSGIEADVREIKESIRMLTEKLDLLPDEREHGNNEALRAIALRLSLRGARPLYPKRYQDCVPMKGTIVLIPFPFTDLTAASIRDAVTRPAHRGAALLLP